MRLSLFIGLLAALALAGCDPSVGSEPSVDRAYALEWVVLYGGDRAVPQGREDYWRQTGNGQDMVRTLKGELVLRQDASFTLSVVRERMASREDSPPAWLDTVRVAGVYRRQGLLLEFRAFAPGSTPGDAVFFGAVHGPTGSISVGFPAPPVTLSVIDEEEARGLVFRPLEPPPQETSPPPAATGSFPLERFGEHPTPYQLGPETKYGRTVLERGSLRMNRDGTFRLETLIRRLGGNEFSNTETSVGTYQQGGDLLVLSPTECEGLILPQPRPLVVFGRIGPDAIVLYGAPCGLMMSTELAYGR